MLRVRYVIVVSTNTTLYRSCYKVLRLQGFSSSICCLSLAACPAEILRTMDGGGNQTRQETRLDSARALRACI
jgi:hypothetical protein